MHWLRTLSLLILTLLLLCLAPSPVQAAEAWLPTATYDGAPVPNFGQVPFSTLPALQDAGAIAVPDEFVSQLGWNPSRAWDAGTPLANVLQLGDVSEAFGLEGLNLGQISGATALDLSKLSLSNLQLLQNQTIASLVKAIPGLGNLPLNQVKPLLDLVNLKIPTGVSWDFANRIIGAIAADNLLGSLSLNNLNLAQFSFTSIPGLDRVALSNFNGWQGSTIAGIPSLDKLPFTQFPINPFQIFGLVATHDVTYGGDRSHKESRQTPTKFSISGSDKVGFHYNCHQARGCDYIELNAPGYSGSGGMSDPGGLHGARWIRGGKGDGEQMVPGGRGILGKLNDGKEPTGRLSFGKAFKAVLTDTDESTGTGRFGLYFRVCIKKGVIDLGCTPYFIGPVPWLSTHEKGLVFVGLANGTGGMDELPPNTQLPSEVQDQIDQVKGQYPDTSEPNDSTLCGSGKGGVDFRALADAISSIEGGYTSAGQWGCDRDGNCGRGLGRYQFMTYREDARAAILKRPGGADFLRRANVASNSSAYLNALERELPTYFPPSDQDAVFKAAMTRNINYYRSQGKLGNALVACLGETWYSGTCSHSNGQDYTGGPTVNSYGQRTANAYGQALKRYGTQPCATTGQSGQKGTVTGNMIYPVSANAPICGRFGEDRGDHIHGGVDFSMPIGTPIKAADGGTVVDACIGCDPNGYGALIIVRHANGLETRYAHVNTITVKTGDQVAQGQVIGTVGSRGRSSGPHLHFEVRKNGQPVNPLPYLHRS